MKKIRIMLGDDPLDAVLLDTPTGRAISEALPLEGNAGTWGEEIYFTVPLKLDLESDAKEEVDLGDLAYWPQGPAFCIFFGATPVSTGDAPRAYSPVNVFGRIEGDLAPLRRVRDGEPVRVLPASP